MLKPGIQAPQEYVGVLLDVSSSLEWNLLEGKNFVNFVLFIPKTPVLRTEPGTL